MKAAVIGAGMAGLRLAQRLTHEGMDVQLFDKARGPSGRLATRRTDEAQFDHGAQYLTARVPSFQAQVEHWLARRVVQEWNASIVRLEKGLISAEESAPKRYVGVPRMSAIGRDLATGLRMELGTRVVAVRKERKAWTLDLEAGWSLVGFDLVLTSVPAPQAVPLLEASPALAQRAEAVRMLPCHALMVQFASQIDVEFDAAFVASSSLGWVARNASKPGRAPGEDWVLHSTSDWSASQLEESAEGIRDRLLDELGIALGRALPELHFSSSHRWLYARPQGPPCADPLWDSELGLGACGDWACGDRVEDAFLSADALADAVLAR